MPTRWLRGTRPHTASAIRVIDMSRIFITFDTETTGLKLADTDLSVPSSLRTRGDEVCQIGGIICDESMEPIKMFCHYCDTVKIDVDRGAQQVNRIYMDEVRKYVRAQYLSIVLMERLREFFYNDVVFIGYNSEFDLSMVKQTVSNTDMKFEWEPLKGSIIPKHGRVSVDVSQFHMMHNNGRTFRQKLSSFDKKLEGPRDAFIQQYAHVMVESNCDELFVPSWNQRHSAFYDALNTHLLWRDTVWRKKLI